MKDENLDIGFDLSPLPKNHDQALEWLMVLVKAADTATLKEVPTEDFKKGWYSIGFLYPGLNPDSATDHGTEVSIEAGDDLDIPGMDQRLKNPFYVESGWPVVLAPVVTEAWRLYEAGELQDDEFYCTEAVIAGMCHRSPEVAEEVRRERGNQR